MSGKSHRGNRWVKGVLTEMAWAASRTKNTYASALYRRLMIHKGKKRALVAVAHHLLEAAWHMLDTGGAIRLSGFARLDHAVFERLLDLLGRALGAAPERQGDRGAVQRISDLLSDTRKLLPLTPV